MTNTYVPKLHANSVQVDEKTGLPEDYNSLFASYRELVTNSAHRLRMPYCDQDDAAQEVQIKFWLKNGLDLYDPDRRTKFATFYRKWSSMFLLQERDKFMRNRERYETCPPEVLRQEDSTLPIGKVEFEDAYLADEFVSQWIKEAEKALGKAGHEELIPLLHLCAEAAEQGSAPSRVDIARVTGRAITSGTNMMKKLRRILTETGLGMETLYG